MTKNKIRILTDHGLEKYFPSDRIRILSPQNYFVKLISKLPRFQWFKEFMWGFKIWWTSINCHHDIPIITVGHGHGYLFATLQFLFKPFIKPRTHIMYAFLLNHKKTGLLSIYDNFKIKVFNSVVDLALVNGVTDVDTFSEEFNIPKDKIRFHPFHITLEKYKFEIKDDKFIFAGGNGARDYDTMIEAIKDINYPFFIATTLPEVKEKVKNYTHITVQSTDHAEFRRKMAACTFFIESHDPNFFRTAGHQTILNAMWMGKAVVMADKRSAIGYYENEVDGIAVEAGDVDGFKREIKRLLENHDFRDKIAAKGMEKLRNDSYLTLNTLQSYYNTAINIHFTKKNEDPQPHLIKLY